MYHMYLLNDLRLSDHKQIVVSLKRFGVILKAFPLRIQTVRKGTDVRKEMMNHWF